MRADRPKIVGANFDPEANMQESLLGFRVADAESVGGAGFISDVNKASLLHSRKDHHTCTCTSGDLMAPWSSIFPAARGRGLPRPAVVSNQTHSTSSIEPGCSHDQLAIPRHGGTGPSTNLS